MGEVDAAFVQELEHRPQPEAIEAEGIPIIDLSPILINTNSNDPPSLERLAMEVGDACKKWGFFQVINHGVATEKREKVESAMKEFFKLPMEEKMKVRRDGERPLGYYESEHTKNVRDWKEVFDFSCEEPILMPASYDPEDNRVTEWPNQWPEYPPQLREACEDYAKEVAKVAYSLLGLIAMSLGLPADRLRGYFQDRTSFLRLNHYAPCPAPDLALGVGRHKDAGALTVLAQDCVGGLQVKRKNDGQWVSVKPTPDALIINVGDIIQVWSNDAYESVEHRVKVNNEKDRFSIPLFFNPAHYTQVEPLQELVNEENPPNYKPYNWGKFLVTRVHSNFRKLNVDNIQISHLRIHN